MKQYASGQPAIRVICIGRMLRGDDALGLLAGQQLQQLYPELSVMSCDGEAGGLSSLLQGTRRVLLLDALSWGLAPGTLIELDPLNDPLPPEWRLSPHSFGLAEGLALAEVLGELPRTLRILGLQAGSFEADTGLTPAVAEAIPSLLQRAVAILETWRQEIL
ncbi:MAG: hydrogenase maturation protease [Candidatus Sericytochromatia bacterium]